MNENYNRIAKCLILIIMPDIKTWQMHQQKFLLKYLCTSEEEKEEESREDTLYIVIWEINVCEMKMFFKNMECKENLF